jgi:hypothetical protein
MRNRILLHTALLLAVTSSGLAAQTTSPLRFGVQAGLNFATWGGDDADGIDTRTGFLVGGFAEYRLNNHFSVRPEVSYSQQGFEANVFGLNLELKHDYIQIPILLKAGASLEGQTKLRPVLYTGPTVSIEVGCQAKLSGSGVPTQEEDCPGDFVKGTDFGLLFGGGLEYGRVSLTARYLLGLTSLDDTGSDIDVKNRVVTILAGVHF